ERHYIGPDLRGKCSHLVSCSHFKVEQAKRRVLERLHIVVPNVTSIFAEVHRDALSSSVHTLTRCLNDVGVARITLVPQRGDVVNVYVELHDNSNWRLSRVR